MTIDYDAFYQGFQQQPFGAAVPEYGFDPLAQITPTGQMVNAGNTPYTLQVDPGLYGGNLTDQAMQGVRQQRALQAQQDAIKQAANRALATDLGISALMAGGQAAAAMIPTGIQREQARELEELQRQEEAGETALDAEVSALMDQAATAGSKIAGEMGMRAESALAASGDQSAGAQQRITQSVMQTAAEGKREAGLAKAEAEYGARQQRRATIESMRAQEFEEEKSRRAAIGQSITQAALLLGQMRGEKPLEVEDVQGLVDMGFDADQIMEIVEVSNRTSRGRNRWIDSLSFAGQYGPSTRA